MKLLVLIHVLSAIIGVGPTFFAHVLLRKNQTLDELRSSMRAGKPLDFFPKIGGSIAVITGIVLLFVGSYGSFMQTWLIGSLVAYVLIQIIAIGFATPAHKKLAKWVLDPTNTKASELPAEQRRNWTRARNYFYAASTIGVILFVFMIMKPA
ncbi:universal stress protein [Paenibacillus aestuarii]|uniref:Universal stress protein n=1 Tax=Paenibacillus aestuarii TaxID=516965 RepID=A0ABW0KAE8_9BACL|nr:universal stress protein [Paenibacillus aestuarii]